MVRVLDANGTAVARVGEKATLGGGGIGKSTVKTGGLFNGPTERRLFERCPGSYFLVPRRVEETSGFGRSSVGRVREAALTLRSCGARR